MYRSFGTAPYFLYTFIAIVPKEHKVSDQMLNRAGPREITRKAC